MRRPPPAVLGIALVLALATTTLTSCTAARNGLGTRVSSCFRLLPEAHAAAGTSSKFAGVQSLPGGDLIKAISREPHQGPLPAPPAALAEVAHQATCLVAFRGRFTLSSVSHGWAPMAGPYLNAVVVVRQSNADLVATVLFRRLPRSIPFFETTAFVR